MKRIILPLIVLFVYSNLIGQSPEVTRKLVHTPSSLSVTVWNDGFFGPHHEPSMPGAISWNGINGVYGSSFNFGTTDVGEMNGIAGVGAYYIDMVNVQSNFIGGFTKETVGVETFDKVTSALLRDDKATHPYGIDVIQKTYSKSGFNVVFCQNAYVNTTSEIIRNFYSSFGGDWEIGNGELNSSGVDTSLNLVYSFEPGTNSPYFGFVVFNELAGCRVYNTKYSTVPEVRRAMLNFCTSINTQPSGIGDVINTIGSFLGDIKVGDTARATFAIVAGDDLEGLKANVKTAFEIAYNAGWTSKIIFDNTTDIDDGKQITQHFKLAQNYPNPFNPTTKINYSIPLVEFGFVPTTHLAIYDILGQEVEILINKKQNPGNYEVTWNARNLTSGVYFCRLQVGSFVETRKMLMIK